MTARNRTVIKEYFNAGDVPTEAQFADLIDSFQMVENMPPTINATYSFYISLVSQSDTDTFQSNPTLAAGDIKVSIDGGALNNVTTLPVVTPAASKLVKVELSAAEMNGSQIMVLFSDASGSEWQDLMIMISTVAA